MPKNKVIDGTEIVDKATIIENIPGYQAEQITINMILWVLVLVSAAVSGVFFSSLPYKSGSNSV